MFVFANLVSAAAMVVSWGLTIYMWVIIVRAFVSWVNPDPYNPVMQFLYRTTEPVLGPIRKRLPYLGGVDISPIIVIMAIVFLKVFLVGTLREIAARLSVNAF